MGFETDGVIVLALDKASGAFVDKTNDIVSLETVGHQYSVRYKGTRYPFKYNKENVVIAQPTASVEVGEDLIEVNGQPWPNAERLEQFDTSAGRWIRVHYATQAGPSFRSYPAGQVRRATNARSQPRSQEIMAHLESVVAAHAPDDPLRNAFGRLRYVHPDSALAAYLRGGSVAASANPRELVFPFASNLSQREALDSALSHQISVIEGPPGTGKTQTILNLIANIVREPGATVGVVSFNNAAVDNVYDKLSREGFGFMAAPMGNRHRTAAFLDGQAERNATLTQFLANSAAPRQGDSQVSMLAAGIDYVHRLEREAAQARATAAQVQRERELFGARYPHLHPELLPASAATWGSAKLLELLADVQLTEFRGTGALARLRWALRKRWHYRLEASADLSDPAAAVELQRRYLDVRLTELTTYADAVEARLAEPHWSDVRGQMGEASLDVLRAALDVRYRGRPPGVHTAESLWRDRDGFALDYPVLLSTCHSLPSNVGNGRLLDYLIIDEASQVSLAIGALAMSVARRVIVVGDTRQLPHIAQDVGGLALAGELEPYDYSRHNVLSSLLAVFGDGLPRTMLREHYRCDPRIIDFCNRTFYGGKLIPMRAEGPGEALALVRTAPGHHSRAHAEGGRTNEREVDVLVDEALPAFCADVQADQLGVVTPFRLQADLIASRLPGVEADTVHKFQGREKSVMVLSTVIDATQSGTPLVGFVDDARMINVAVSRAQDRLVVIANPDLPEECVNLHALIDFIEQRSPGHVLRSDIISVFDVLYTEYAAVLRSFAAKLGKRTPFRSEEAALVMLERLLETDEFQHLRVNYQVFLYNLVPAGLPLTPDEAALVRHRSSVDLVISNRATDQALGVIEVDGFTYHQDNPEQLRRDALKDAILARSGLALLRLRTTGHGEEAQAEAFLRGLGGGGSA